MIKLIISVIFEFLHFIYFPFHSPSSFFTQHPTLKFDDHDDVNESKISFN